MRSAQAGEPMAGTAPVQSHLLLVESPGGWGPQALRSSALADREALLAMPARWRVILVRRPDRPQRRQHDRTVWLAGPGGARRWVLPLQASVLPDALPGPGEPVLEPVLFICSNGARDRCCALAGRPLLDALRRDPVLHERVWECSHLGGHRFAATAVRLPDRMVFGRLTEDVARQVLAGAAPSGYVRGRTGPPPPVQAAE